MRAQTESVVNHNHCHAITVEYFEVLRHLQVSIELSDVQECLFIPLLMSKFDFQNVLRWRQPLQIYLQRNELSPAFDAIQRVITNWSDVNTPVGQYADESIITIRGELHITFFIPLPPLNIPEGSNIELRDKAEAIKPITGFISILLGVVSGALAGTVVAQGASAVVDILSNEPSPQQRYDKFHRDVMPSIAVDFVDQLQMYVVVNGTEKLLDKIDFTLVTDYYAGGKLLVSVRGSVNPSIVRSNVTSLIIKSGQGLPVGCRVIINDAFFRYRTKNFEHLLVNEPKLNDDLGMPLLKPEITLGASPNFFNFNFSITTILSGDGATLDTPIDSWEQINPRIEDQRLAKALLDHLNINLEYYHSAIWHTMSEKRRFMLLDGFIAPNSNGRSVASVVENRLIGIIGNSLIMPVARSFHLDPTFNQDRKEPEDLLKLYAPNNPIPPLHITIPTRGVFAESIMGSCNSCEEKDDSKFWRFEESPCGNEPTPIQPISTESRRIEPNNMIPQQLPAPMINL
jgi:hypothetical protein